MDWSYHNKALWFVIFLSVGALNVYAALSYSETPALNWFVAGWIFRAAIHWTFFGREAD